MMLSLTPRNSSPLTCLPLPTVLVRAGVLVVVLVFVLVLLRWGHDVVSCLALVAGLSVVAVRTGQGISRPSRAWPLINIAR